MANYSPERHTEASTDFSAPGQVKRLRTVTLWKGDHNRCEHGTGVCIASNGWQFNSRGAISPISIAHPTEARFNVIEEWEGPNGPDVMVQWKRKGFRPIAESVGVKPSQSVFDHLAAGALSETEKNLEHKGASHADTTAAVDAQRDKMEATRNALYPPEATEGLKRRGRE